MPNATIANMLSQSGANIGRAIGSPVAQIGKDIGGMLTARSERKAQDAQDQQVQKELQEYASDPAQLNAMGQKYQSMGKLDVAKAFYEAAKQATAKVDKRTQATGSRGKGELMALANNPKFDITNPKMQSGYFGMADSFGVSREDAMNIALEAKKNALEAKKREEETGKVTSSRGAGTYRDKDGNLYELGIVRTTTGERKNWTPISPGAPAVPSSKLTPVGGSYTESASDKTQRDVETAGGTTEAEQFAKLRIEAVDALPAIERTIRSTESSLEVLETIKRTGGFSTAVVRAAQKFLGEEPANEADFNLKAGQQVLDGLNAFEGAISEGERNYLESLYQSLVRSKGANRAILEEMLDVAKRNLRDAETRATSDTFEQYMTNRQSFGAPLTPPNRRVKFGDLPRGS
jgi:hypothetical protein